jgi:hypothetical protein
VVDPSVRKPRGLDVGATVELMDYGHGVDYNAGSEYPVSLLVGESALVEQLRGMSAIVAATEAGSS